jgi:hypothetical protein
MGVFVWSLFFASSRLCGSRGLGSQRGKAPTRDTSHVLLDFKQQLPPSNFGIFVLRDEQARKRVAIHHGKKLTLSGAGRATVT